MTTSQIPQGRVETRKRKQADLKDNDSPSETVSINVVPLQSIPSLPSINSPCKKKMVLSESDLSDVENDHQGESEVSSIWDTTFSTSAMVKDHLSFLRIWKRLKKVVCQLHTPCCIRLF